MHGLIFFYLQKFVESAPQGSGSWKTIQATTATTATRFLPSAVYPDADAVAILASLAETSGRPLPKILEEFGRFLAPHLLKVAQSVIDPSWRTLELVENTESIIHAMVRMANPGAAPPVLETVRPGPDQVHLVYSSPRRLCPLAVGLVHGFAAHYGETVTVEEPSCQLRGDLFCSFVIQRQANDTRAEAVELRETAAFHPLPNDGASDRSPRPFVGTHDDEIIPKSIGGYRVLDLLGRGSMGRVYLAEDTALDRRVAIKVMLPSRANDPAARVRFLRESRATAAVEHPNVVTIYQVGEHSSPNAAEHLPFIVMQWLRGDTLASARSREPRIPLAEVLRIGRQIAEGLWAAHSRGLIHRDIKPENVFLEGSARQVKIIDFGLARDADTDPSLSQVTTDGTVVGTPAYMSPERIGDRAIDARSDLFGLGVILYELLAGRLPFSGKSMMAVLAAISRGEPTPLSEIVPGIPGDVAALVMRLIAHDPDARPADARTVADVLAALEKSHAPR